MEANTPATPESPDDNPIQDRVSKESFSNQSISNQSVSNQSVSAPVRPKGPNAAPVVLGLVALVLSALIIANETTGLRVDWSALGPGGIIGVGVLLAVLGAIGLVRRHDDS